MLSNILELDNKRVITMSSDDFYLTYKERQELAIKHPFLKFRGPPGTVDVKLMRDCLTKIKAGTEECVELPLFDKSLHSGQGDRTGYKSVNIKEIDFIILEGWFTGFLPLQNMNDEKSLSELAIFSDENLQGYEDWSFIDRLIVLRPQDFKYSYLWRLEAEKRMGKGLTESEIELFVSYFIESLKPDLYYDGLKNHKKLKVGPIVVLNEKRRVVKFEEII